MAIDKNKEFLEKHKPMSQKEIQNSFVDAEKAREKYSKDISEIEGNLTSFLEKEDPIVDPGTGKILAWMRDAPIAELMIYSNEFKAALVGMSDEEAQKKLDEDPELVKKQYAMMANLITKPKKDSLWWSQHTTPDFSKLFELALTNMMSRGNEQSRFFSQPTMGTE